MRVSSRHANRKGTCAQTQQSNLSLPTSPRGCGWDFAVSDKNCLPLMILSNSVRFLFLF